MNSNTKEIQHNSTKKMYDVASYTDRELLDILDLSSPTDRELEAKIIFLINKYRNIQNESGDELAAFFEDIYSHFFQTSEDENEDEDNADIIEGIEEELAPPTNQEVLQKLDDANYLDSSKAKMDKVTNYTKSLEYSKGKLNPLLQQTVRRVITIDSQYRQDKRSLSTDFNLNLSEPLKDIVSMKLYSVEIPYVWWTINSSFGSNFFILKGNVPGIDNGNHDYQIEITPGNYSPSELSDSINENIAVLKTNYTDIDFGSTAMEYNKYSSLITLNTEIYKQYNEVSYYIRFSGWTTPEPENDIDYFTNRSKSIPSFLGFKEPSYNFTSITGEPLLPLIASPDSFRYTITSTNNSFIVEKFVRIPNSTAAPIDLTITITLSLTMGVSYTRTAIYNNLIKVLNENQYLSDESKIERIDINETLKSYFKLFIKPNRLTTNNIPNSKLRIVFPTETITETTPQLIWTGTTSCFKFIKNETVINDLYSEVSPLVQQTDKFAVTTSPYIYLKNIERGYDISTNEYRIDIPNSDISYNVNTYINLINKRISDLSNGEILSTSNAYLDNEGRFHLQFDMLRTITTGKYKVDFSNSVFNTIMGFNEVYELNEGINIFDASFGLQNSYVIPSNKLFTVTAKENDNYVGSDLSYNIYLNNDTGVIGGGKLFQEINNLLKTFTDAANEYIFAGSALNITVTDDDIIYASLQLNVNKQLREETYSIQFLEDISYSITNTIFQLEQGDSLDIGGENVPYLMYNNETDTVEMKIQTKYNVDVGILRDKGFLGTAPLLSIPDRVMEYTINIADITSYVINSDYLLYISVATPDTITPDYGRSALYNSSNPYGYLIPTPQDASYNNLSALQVGINRELNRFTDLTGSNIEIIENADGSTAKIKLSLFINQQYYFNSWNKHVNIDHAMIDNEFPLLNSQIESVYDVNRQFTDLSFSYMDEEGNTALGIKSNSYILQNLITLTEETNKIEIIPYEEGVIADENTITIELPIKSGNNDIRYTRNILLESIKNQLNETIASESTITVTTIEGVEYTLFRITVNKEYTAKDYRISFFDPYSFVKCFQGVTSVRNTTWDSTLGWILGFRQYTVYDLANYLTNGSSVSSITADTGINTELFNYFMLCIDDYNQSHLNDGLVTITTRDTETPLPSYAIRTNFRCDPTTGEKVYNTDSRTDYNKLTEKQIQSLVSKANARSFENDATTGNVSSKIYGSTPFVSDVFGIIPLKLSGHKNGDTIVEFGGTLQDQERQYFGPVNIHRMNVKLVSDRGNVVDFNNANWSFSLICEQLYKPQPT